MTQGSQSERRISSLLTSIPYAAAGLPLPFAHKSKPMRFTIANLLIVTAMIAVLFATAMRWRGVAILVVTLVLPLLVLRLKTIDKTRHKFPAFLLFLASFVPLYVASLGPYYFLAVHVAGKGSFLLICGSYFYSPLFALLKANNKQLFEPFFEYYLSDWIGYGLLPDINAP